MSTKFKVGDNVKVAEKLPLKLRNFPFNCSGKIAEANDDLYSVEFEDGRRVGWYPAEVLTLEGEKKDD